MLYADVAGTELIEDPEPLLRERERQLAATRWRRQDRGSSRNAVAPPLLRLDSLGQSGDRRILKQRPQRQLDLKDVPDPRNHLHRDEGMAADLEEVVVDTNAVAI